MSDVECTSHIPHPTTYKISRVVNNYIFRLKKRSWKQLRVSFVAPSTWMAEWARRSKLFADAPVEVILNGLDLEVFQPLEQLKCRQRFGLPQDKKLILFGAHNPMDPNKGLDLLEKALLAMPKDGRDGVELVVFGANGSQDVAGLRTHWMGVISSEEEMVELYNAGDVICVPSRRESFGQIASEAMACGVPVVAFRTSGLIDIVDHKENGYLAEPFDPESFAQGLQWIFRHSTEGGAQESGVEALSINARLKAEAEFSLDLVSRKIISVYEGVKRGDTLGN